MSVIETATVPLAQQQADALTERERFAVSPLVPRTATSRLVNDLNFSLRAGETLGIVGESGSGNRNCICVDGPVGCQRTYWRIGNLQWA